VMPTLLALNVVAFLGVWGVRLATGTLPTDLR
jgi:hypothetical protein